MKIHTLPLGPIQTNCYIVEQESTVIIIDPGAEAEKIFEKVKLIDKRVCAVLLTHTHFDHIGAVDEVVIQYNCPLYVSKEEQYWLTNPVNNGSTKYKSIGIEEVVVYSKPKIFNLGPLKIDDFECIVRKTPGHSPGSVSFIFEKSAIVGDTLFKEGIGRTDLVDGNMQTLMHSIHNELLTLEDDTVIYPGHGPKTTIGYEIDMNPYLNGY